MPRHRGMAVAIIGSGSYLAGTVWPLVVQHFIGWVGWRWTYRGSAVFWVTAMVPLIIAGLSCGVAMSMPQVHIVAYGHDLGHGAGRGARMLSLMLGFGIVSSVLMATVLGRALGGWVSDVTYDLTGSYQAAFLNGILWNLLNLAIAVALLRQPGTPAAQAHGSG